MAMRIQNDDKPLSTLLESIDETIEQLETSIKALHDVWHGHDAGTKRKSPEEEDDDDDEGPAKHPCYDGSETEDDEPPMFCRQHSSCDGV